MRTHWVWMAVWVWGTASGACDAAALSDPSSRDVLEGARELIAWGFDDRGDLQGWQPNQEMDSVRVAEGVFHARSTGADPIFVGPVFEIQAAPWQWIEITLRSDLAGQPEVFWTGTLEGPYGGFTQDKATRFQVPGDGAWHTHRLFPFWHAEGRIARLRFDSFAEAAIDVDSIRIMEGMPPQPGGAGLVWGPENQSSWLSWFSLSGARLSTQEGEGLLIQTGSEPSIAMAPMLPTNVAGSFFVNVRMKSTSAKDAAIRWVTRGASGMGRQPFRPLSDGEYHWFNVDMSSSALWAGELLALGVEASGGEGEKGEKGGEQVRTSVAISHVSVSEEPQGDPELAVSYCGPEEGINRVGRPFNVILCCANRSGPRHPKAKARLEPCEGVRLAKGRYCVTIPPVEFGTTATATWQIVCETPGPLTLRFRLDAGDERGKGDEGEKGGIFEAHLTLSEDPKVEASAAVPPPQPIETSYEIGAYYFPGWASPASWFPIMDTAPLRKPALGWYDEALPEVADWQIKWSVEHGIRFYLVDWYWDRGSRGLDHWLHNAYGRASYRAALKYAVMWANHNGPGSHSEEDWRAVTQYWIDHYFPMDEYYRIDDQPAVFIWAPSNIRRDVGGTEQAAKLYAESQSMAKAAGFKGIYFAAMSDNGDPESCRRLQSEGYEGFTSYHTFEDALHRAPNPQRFPYSLVAETSPDLWARCHARSSMAYFPVVDTGWSSEPWHGEGSLSITDRTPSVFRDLCQKAKDDLDARGQRIAILGPMNEWGEGSYIEPCTEFGFEMLDAVREVFGQGAMPHLDLVPQDVGLGPYDLFMEEDLKAFRWRFEKEGDLMGWSAMMGLADASVGDGRLRAKTSADDPAFKSPALRLSAGSWPTLRIRVRIQSPRLDDACQVFWTSNTVKATSEANSVHAPVLCDGKMREVVLDMASAERWRGIIQGLRWDPCTVHGAAIEVEEIRFSRRPVRRSSQ